MHWPARRHLATGAGVALLVTGCADPLALVPLEAPTSTTGPSDSASPAEAAPADLSEMPLPDGRTLWSWDIVGEAVVVDPGTIDAQWAGHTTWSWRDESTGSDACVAELDTVGIGTDDSCSEAEGCLFGMNVEHLLVSLDGPEDCWDHLGLPEGDGPLDLWGLGYADAWSDGTVSADHSILYLWSRDSKTFPGAFRPMGTATWDADSGTFSYTFDTLWFFIVEG